MKDERSSSRRQLWILASVVLMVSIASAQPLQLQTLHRMFPENGGAKDVVLGDLDGDGDLDAVIASPIGARLCLNDGSGTFADVTYPNLPLWYQVEVLALADADGDGDLDLFSARPSIQYTQQLNLSLNDGSGVFSAAPAANLPVVLNLISVIALGDLDGDGDLDAILGHPGGNAGTGAQNRLLLNDGTGVFSDATATHLPATIDATVAIALGDLDADGDPDMMIANGHNFVKGVSSIYQNRLYLNDGTGVFSDATASSLPLVDDPATDLALGDLDGDGDLDAVLAESSDPNRLLLNDGSGVFSDATGTSLPASPAAADTRAVGLDDVDGDGDLDALLANCQTQNRLLLNDGFANFTDATTSLLPPDNEPCWALALDDIDGDGDPDALVGNGGQTSYLLLNDGSGRFIDPRIASLPPSAEASAALALGDLDGDGDLDALVGSGPVDLYGGAPPAPNRLYLGEGSGIFSDATASNLPADSDATRALALGDVDGDGDLDALIGNVNPGPLSGQNRLYLNDGQGSFTDVTPTHLPQISDFTSSLALGDVDGDGDLDALTGESWNSWPGIPQNRLYLNDGSGIFTDVTAAQPSVFSNGAEDLALADLDGDGDLDALIGQGVLSQLLLNDGTGVFTLAPSASLPLFFPGRATAIFDLADLDGDGDLDVLWGNWGGGGVLDGEGQLWLNNGAGAFTDVTNTHLNVSIPMVPASGVDLGDVDGDGDVDAVMGFCGSATHIYLNDGFGVFTNAPSASIPQEWGYTMATALGDLDGDEDLDILIGNNGPDRVLLNLSRQLAWRGLPRFGKPLTIDLYGASGEPWILCAALGTHSIPSVTWGTLKLDPASLIVLDQGVLDAGGRGAVTYQIGANPGGAAGLTVYAQALFGTSLRLGNRETFIFTDL